jgi:hypothetical protein
LSRAEIADQDAGPDGEAAGARNWPPPGQDGRKDSMIGVVLVTHGNLADEFKSAVEHVVGAQVQFATVCIGAEDDMEQRRRDILARVADVDGGDGVIIVTDMFGGTPSNLSISVMEAGPITAAPKSRSPKPKCRA